MRYILNSAVITTPGTYEYKLITLEEAKRWLSKGAYVSAIGYSQTAELLQELTGYEIIVNRRMIKMEPGDEALIFRIVLPVGTKRINPQEKGTLDLDFIKKHMEIGILKKIK